MIKLDQPTYIASDPHFGHDKEFLFKPRGFNSIEEHDEEIIKRWNSVVSPDANVIILGDLMLNDNAHGIECLKQLNGKKYFIIGNHDTDNRIKLYEDAGLINLGYSNIVRYKKYHFYISHYVTLTSNYDIDKPLKARVINLCGHTHTNDRFADFDKGLVYHCEIDVDGCPISLDKIIDDIKNELNETV